MHRPLWLFFFWLLNAGFAFYLIKKTLNKKYSLDYRFQELQEKINILNDENLKEFKHHADLQTKILRYHSLKKVVEKINEELDLDSVAEQLSSVAFSIVGNNKGTCLIYLVDSQSQKLRLLKAKKENGGPVIKAKEGDMFDYWVLRHSGPLLVEDVKRDFRFDPEKLKTQDTRPVSSLASAPFISEHRILGLLRVDNPLVQSYSQDDLRFLMTVSDLGAVALENSQLFQKTQDLAIHDSLTSLYTKGYFSERLQEEFKRSQRSNAPFSVLMVDIDFFKKYNDKFGHTAGDIVLKKIGANISASLKDYSSIISRFGGEEFCIALLGIGKDKARQVAESLRGGIEKEKIMLRRQESNVTVSAGVATFPDDGADEKELIQKADKAMYQAKEKGRNRVCCI